MHRSVQIVSPEPATEALVNELKELDGVITLSLRRGESHKPPGDVISATVLNTSADAVLREVEARSHEHGAFSIMTSSVDSLIDTDSQPLVYNDEDESAWEEAETALRRHTRLNLNFFLTTAAGAVLAMCALVSSSTVTQATALVAAAVIAPAFEPLARIALALITRHRRTLLRGALSAAAGYLTMFVVAGLTMLVLRSGGHIFVSHLLTDRTFHEVQHPPAINLIISAGGALAGVTMISAGRFSQLAGPLVALQLLPAAASFGGAIELGDGGAAARSLGRLGIDIGMVIVAGLIVFAFKHLRVHSRRPVLH